MENFGFSFAEDAWEAALGGDKTSESIIGEARLKAQFVPSVQKRSLLTDDYNILERVSEMNLLTATARAGVLTALDEKGLTLTDLEKLLPIAEKLNLLSALKNPIVYNLILPLLIEPAPLLIGPLVGVIKTDPLVFTGLGALLLGLEAKGIAASGEINLPLLVGVVLFGGLGQLLAGNVAVPDADDFEVPSGPNINLPGVSLPSLPSIGGGVPRRGGLKL